LQWLSVILVDSYNLLGFSLGLACGRGVFFSHIYIADSRRVSAPAYIGKQA